MTTRDIIVIGASAGGVEALRVLIASLPSDLKAAVLVVLHVPEHSKSRLSEILQDETSLEVIPASEGKKIIRNKIYVAQEGAHLLVEDGTTVIGRGPKENRFRPSIDALFRSAAYHYKSRVIGILLSGAMDDGNSGLWTIKHFGGLAMVQDEREAMFPQMIMNAKHYVEVDHEVPAAEMGALLHRLTQETPGYNMPDLSEKAMELIALEIIVAKEDDAYELGVLKHGEYSPITCPECHGALVQLKEGMIIRYRCHTGHAFTVSSLLAGVSESINDQLWQAMKGMEENAILLEKLSDHFQGADQLGLSNSYIDKAQEFKQKARAIHAMILDHEQISGDPEKFKRVE